MLNSDAPVKFGIKCAQVLVTGGTGFIGQLLVRALIADGHKVIVLTRNPKRTATFFHHSVVCVDDMSELPTSAVIDVVINLAGARILGWRWSEARQAVLRASRITLTESIVAWIAQAQHKPRLFLSASAIGYYGIQKQGDDSELTEESHSQSIFMATLCRDWENSAQAATRHGVNVATMRFGLVLGKQGALPMLLLPIKLGLGGTLGSGKQWISWIHVQDLLRAIAHLWRLHLNNTPPQLLFHTYNFTAPEALRQLDFSRVAAKVLHRPCFFPTPAWPMRLFLGHQADLLLEGQRVAPVKLLESGFEFLYPNTESALRSLV